MTTLLIDTDSTPLTVNLPTLDSMGLAPFRQFCQANRDLRIERTITGEVIVMLPTCSDTSSSNISNHNFNLATQLGIWLCQNLYYGWIGWGSQPRLGSQPCFR